MPRPAQIRDGALLRQAWVIDVRAGSLVGGGRGRELNGLSVEVARGGAQG